LIVRPQGRGEITAAENILMAGKLFMEDIFVSGNLAAPGMHM
jgi:hypothetical protein